MSVSFGSLIHSAVGRSRIFGSCWVANRVGLLLAGCGQRLGASLGDGRREAVVEVGGCVQPRGLAMNRWPQLSLARRARVVDVGQVDVGLY